jgi:hypothetical protein
MIIHKVSQSKHQIAIKVNTYQNLKTKKKKLKWLYTMNDKKNLKFQLSFSCCFLHWLASQERFSIK